MICIHGWKRPRTRRSRLHVTSTYPRRLQGDLRATNRQDSIDAPAIHVIAAGSFAKYDASRRAPFVAMLERVGAFPIPNEMIAIVCAFWLRAGEHYGDVEDDEDAWAADLEEELFS